MTKRVLTVDDSKTMRDMVTFTLKNAGFAVAEAGDGADALRLLDEDGASFDLIITDLNMPVMDGFTLIENIRSHAKYKFTPILMLTTESDPQKKERGKALGATGWIVKPFNPDKLVQVVSKVCG